MANQNRFGEAVVAGLNTRANIIKNTTYAQAQGELALSTDANNLFYGDANYRFQPLQSLDMALVDMGDGQIITDMSTGTICYTF